MSQIEKVKADLEFVENLFRKLLKILPAFYHHRPEFRSRGDFLKLPQQNSRSIGLRKKK